MTKKNKSGIVYIDIGQNIKRLRTAKHLSQMELSKLCGFGEHGYTTICRYETGNMVPSEVTIEKLAKALGCNKSDICASTDMKIYNIKKTITKMLQNEGFDYEFDIDQTGNQTLKFKPEEKKANEKF